ncbi:hypothetical protein HID58_051770 [Brassica napus]|uniref:Vacuolar ATPase assembly integral membrane protein VMA21 homolog n=3 Tax=Brassica TaxID=3705 RepID=A0A816I6M1_BRANA|nr:hypothetical protein Bca52824_043403 [Brassica carinata]KAH0889341.1 hypothetical protein HID58_051770 [Brassica napus]CAF1699715.1 unnamed protein product [Brassica napus]
MMMENKRSVCSLEESSMKRHKSDLSFSSKERKDKVGERVSALQQLVSPYGKTDTASVLLEAMQYIQFLQEQVKVLSAPYLQTSPTITQEEMEEYSLRSRGLCLVPMEYTLGVAQSNGADIWAPINMAGVMQKFLVASMFMWMLPIAILYGFNNDLLPGSTTLSPHSLTLLSGFLAVVSVNVVIVFYICLALKEPVDKHKPDASFVAEAKDSVKKLTSAVPSTDPALKKQE